MRGWVVVRVSEWVEGGGGGERVNRESRELSVRTRESSVRMMSWREQQRGQDPLLPIEYRIVWMILSDHTHLVTV